MRAIGADAIERCRLVAVQPAIESAVVATALDELVVVHAGEDAPRACGPFRIAAVLPDRVVLEPTSAAGGSAVRVWLPLASEGGSAAPVVLSGSPQPSLPELVSPIGSRPQPGNGNRRIRVEQPPP
jgi:hypothetical protein